MNTNLIPKPYDSRIEGIVYKKTIGQYLVRTYDGMVSCHLSSSLQKQAETSRKGKVREVQFHHRDPVAVGDEVRIDGTPGGVMRIVEILPRRNRLSRRSAVPMPGAQPGEQIIAANIDQVMPVFAAACPAPPWNLLDRYLVSAGAAGIPAVVCITKLDLAGRSGEIDPDLVEIVQEYRQIGYPVVLTSVPDGSGLADLKEILRGKTTVLVGKSGVGKTSLLNTLEPGLGRRVSEISQTTGKGRHTTTVSELFPLAEGGALLDTPGIREFGLWDVLEDDLAVYFPEIKPFIGNCKFGLDCSHDEEPGCAVRKAVMDGLVSPRRYASYIRLKEEG